MAPNLDLFLWRPILAEPPIYTLADLHRWVTITHVMEAHEALNLKEAANEKARDT